MTHFVHNSTADDNEKEGDFPGGALGDLDEDFDGDDDGTEPLEEDDDDEDYVSSFDDHDDY